MPIWQYIMSVCGSAAVLAIRFLVSAPEVAGRWVAEFAQVIARRGACCRMAVVIVWLLATSFVYSYASHRVAQSGTLIDDTTRRLTGLKKGSIVEPFADHLVSMPCLVVTPPNNAGSKQSPNHKRAAPSATDVFGAARLDVTHYIASTRYHLLEKRMIGLTPYHVGAPLCAVVLAKRSGSGIRTLYNPFIVESSARTVRQVETDLVCETSRRVSTRHINITVSYDKYEDRELRLGSEIERGAQTRQHRGRYRESFTGAESLVLQYLVDLLEGRSVCTAHY